MWTVWQWSGIARSCGAMEWSRDEMTSLDSKGTARRESLGGAKARLRIEKHDHATEWSSRSLYCHEMEMNGAALIRNGLAQH